MRTSDGMGLRATVFRATDELASIRPVWEALAGRHLTADPDHFLTVLDRRPEAVRPHVVLLSRDGEPVALAIGRIEDIRMPAKIGYREIVAPRLRALTIVYGGVLGDATPGTHARLLEELRSALSDGEADILRLRMLERGTPLHARARELSSTVLRGHFGQASVHLQAALPGTFDEFLQGRSSKTRQNIRYYGKRLRSRYGDALRLETFHTGKDLDRLYRDTARVAETTYQSALDASFVDTPLRRALTELGIRKGWFRAYVLYLDDRPVAYWHGSTFRGVHGPGVTGYDPAFRNDRVGTFVLARRLEDACDEPAVTTADFGFGDAEYKRHVADTSWLEEDVLLYAPSLRAASANAARTAVLGTAALGRRLLRDDGSVARVKRIWRDRLRKS